MSDEQQDLNLEDVGAGGEEAGRGKRPKILSGLMLTILKYAAIGIGIIILAVTATAITVGIIERGKTPGGLSQLSDQFKATQVPLAYFDSIEAIRGQTADETPAIFQLKLSLGYDMNAKDVSAELGQRAREIQDIVLKMVSLKTAAELSPQYYEDIQNSILNLVNRIMTNGKIKRVTFREFSVVK
jgi:flagellar basal body-associated protein FliL